MEKEDAGSADPVGEGECAISVTGWVVDCECAVSAKIGKCECAASIYDKLSDQ